MATTNYVKFLRGSSAAYQIKVNEGSVDKDTLYFIYETPQSKVGQLYLGDKLISGGDANLTNSSIGELKDIAIDNIGDRQILIYDAENSKWINSNIDDAIGTMVGATATMNGDEGLVPAPQAGDQNKFLRGDGTWVPEFITTVDLNSFQVIDGSLNLADDKYLLTEEQKRKIDDLVIDEDGKVAISGTVSAANVEGLQELLDAKADKTDLDALEDRVDAIENVLYDTMDDSGEQVVNYGVASKVEIINKILAGYVDDSGEEPQNITGLIEKVENNENAIGNIDDLIDTRTDEEKENADNDKITIIESINKLYNMLIWQEISEEEEM